MNKTVNINLAGIFFHIDEDAYSKLQRYLDAIKRSFTDSQGRNEIIADIEARIAELFNERVQNEKQVVSIKEVDEVIAIMGQPEDYMVDDEIFDDEPKKQRASSSRKLFRDTDNAYIGGVSAGLAHYFNIDTLWIRLAWVILFFGMGTGVLLYILLWVLMPAAESTADKLAMSGKPINITNIEEKVKEGFSNVKDSLDDVADRVKNGDYEKVGNKVKSTSRSFFDALGNVIMFFFKIIGKFIGIILIIVGATTLFALIVSLLSVGVADMFHFDGFNFADVVYASTLPIWIISILALFAVGIPFFFIFILGLKILVNNLKPLNRMVNITLLGLWLASIITLAIFAAREVQDFAREASVTDKQVINIAAADTLKVSMVGNEFYNDYVYRDYDYDLVTDENDNKLIYSSNVRLIFRSTKDSLGYIKVDKSARGPKYSAAKARANAINYNYALNGNTLNLDGYFLMDAENKFRDQEVEIIVYLPEGTILYADDNTYSFHRNSSSYRDILDNGFEEHYLEIIDQDVRCLDCPGDKNYKVQIDIKDDDSTFKYDEDGLEIKDADVNIKVNRSDSDDEDADVKVKIDSSGIQIKSNDN
ncbi:MAG: PspC domain-containing protein [Bacteroidia bacterium]|nr:PspC domain-containing protein [Bacteroidia bacterium]NND26410.1 PspC domain-containing protein [Flavobacteriaceae bacterium]NNK59004.1 PspC domain-containing protein [Flavobacteriaceae bacterium]NNL32576.1 PspC domain-containing protein [Flavobacteriaceae bacterium]RZW45068.1 MAG: PspC domain-containing protein [Flavobacteriaceae bacterium]